MNRVLEILKTFNRQQSNDSAVKHWVDTSVIAVIRREQPILDSTTSLFSTSNGADTLDSSPTSAMSLTLTGNSHTAELSSCTTSPATLSQTSVSPTSSDSSRIITLYCPECPESFTGIPQDARTNLQRHLKYSPRHNSNPGLKCPQPECETKNSMRPDNLGPHLQKFHKISSKPARQSIIDQSKSSANREISSMSARQNINEQWKLSAKGGDRIRKPRRRSNKKE